MGRRADSYANWRQQENMMEYSHYVNRFKRLLITMFNWTGLPDGISEKFLENSLYEKGLVIFFKSKVGLTKGSYVLANAMPQGYNIYDEPIGFRAYSNNNIINQYVKSSECVVIYNDYLCQPSVQTVNFYSKRLSNIERTIDCNLENLKQPVMVSCDETQLESVKAFWTAKTTAIPIIPVSKDFKEKNNFQVFDLKATNNIPQLEDTKRMLLSEALTHFGIQNVPVSKKERLITSEANQNNEQIFYNANVMLKPRLEACEKINKMFNDLDVKVELSSNYSQNVNDLLGGGNNE